MPGSQPAPPATGAGGARRLLRATPYLGVLPFLGYVTLFLLWPIHLIALTGHLEKLFVGMLPLTLLAGQGAGSVQNAQQAQSRFDVSRARLAQNRAALVSTRKQTDILQAQQGAAEASLLRARAGLQRAELDLSHTQLRAPIDGIVGRRAVRVGALVAPGASLMAVVPLNRSFVVANLQETQLTRVRQGQRASIAVDAYPGVLLHGTVHSIAPATGVTFAAIAPENATGNFTKVVQRIPVRIALDPGQDGEHRLRVGMSAEVRIDTAMRRQQLQQVSAR